MTSKAKTSFGFVLRDMMQSTGIWCFNSTELRSIARLSADAGFSHLEIGGGQSFQIALQQGINPYHLIQVIKQELDKHSVAIKPQVLLRGANQFGFHHYSQKTQQKNLDLLIGSGGDNNLDRALVIRIFDALNDIENLRYSIEYLVNSNKKAEQTGGKRVNVQAALSYVKPVSLDPNALYSVDYYIRYATALRKVAQNAGGDLNSICIKDMSSQLDAATANQLVSAFEAMGLPVILHCHSTDEARSIATLIAAAESGASAIEVALAPLSGGTSHQDVRNLIDVARCCSLNNDSLSKLEAVCHKEFFDRATDRKDFQVPVGSLKQLCALGIPGGAVPFIIHDLDEQVCKMLGMELNQAIAEFSVELARLQQQLGQVPLVTPTADIIAKQVIKNLGNRARSEQYKLMDPRFCALVLGHYGEVVNHASTEKIEVQAGLVEEVKSYCEAIDDDPLAGRVKAGKVFPEPKVLDQHPSIDISVEPYELAKEYVEELSSRYPESVARFGSIEECTMMQVMRPAGNSERLLTRNILAPTEHRLRELLTETLSLLPQGMIPESRNSRDNEETDVGLLDLLGGYEGIIDNIKDLVMHTESKGLHDRLEMLENNIVDRFCEGNEQAQSNRFYVERRFVALFAAAVFWDLQRICRRTGSDSRADINEVTANSLGRIISVTLRKRKEEGVGRSSSYLV